VDPRRRTVYTLKITEVHPKVIHTPAVVVNDITVAHDVTDPRYDAALAAKYDSAHTGQMTPDNLSETSTVSATEADDMDTTDAKQRMMSERFRQEKAASFVAKHHQPRVTQRPHPYRFALSCRLSTMSAGQQLQQQLRGRSSYVNPRAVMPRPGGVQSDVVNTPTAGVSRLSSSTLKLLGLSNHISSTPATTTTSGDHRYTLPSSSLSADNLCHNEFLLTMAKRLNDAAARSARGSAPASNDGVESMQHSIETPTLLQRPHDSADFEMDLHRSLQTDGPPYHDSDTDEDSIPRVDAAAFDSSTGVYCTDESELRIHHHGIETDNRHDVVDDAGQCASMTLQSNSDVGSSPVTLGSVDSSESSTSMSAANACSSQHTSHSINQSFSSAGVRMSSCIDAGMKIPCIVLHDVMKSGRVVISHDGTCQLSRAYIDNESTYSLISANTGLAKDASSEEKVVSASAATLLAATHTLPSCVCSTPLSLSTEASTDRQSTTDQFAVACDSLRAATEATATLPVSVSLSANDPHLSSSSSSTAINCSVSASQVSTSECQSDVGSDNVGTDAAMVATETASVSPPFSSVSADNLSSSSPVSSVPLSSSDTQCYAGTADLCSLMSASTNVRAGNVGIDTAPVAMETMSASPLSTSVSPDNLASSESLSSSSDTNVGTANLGSGAAAIAAAETASESLPSLSVSADNLPSSASLSSSEIQPNVRTGNLYTDTAAVSMETASAPQLSSLIESGPAVSVESVESGESAGIEASGEMNYDSAVTDNVELSGAVDATENMFPDTTLSTALSQSAVGDRGYQDDVDEDDDDGCSVQQMDIVSAATTGMLQTGTTSSQDFTTISAKGESETMSSTCVEGQEVELGQTVESSLHSDIASASHGTDKATRTMSSQNLSGISAEGKSEAVSSIHIEGKAVESAQVIESSSHSDIALASWRFNEVCTPTSIVDANANTQALAPSLQTVSSVDDANSIPVLTLPFMSASCYQLSLSTEMPSVMVVPSKSLPTLGLSSPSARVVNAAASQVPTCHLSSLNQLLGSAVHSRPYFIHVVAAQRNPTASEVPASLCDQVPALTALHQSEVSNHSVVVAAMNEKSSLSSSAVSVSGGTNRIRKLLQADDEPVTKKVRTSASLGTIPLLVDGSIMARQKSFSSPSLVGPRNMSANEGGYRVARASTVISRDVWARPRVASNQSGTLHTAKPGSQPSPVQAGELQISLQPSTHSVGHPLIPAASRGTQPPRELKNALQPGTQPVPVLSDRSNYSMRHPTHGAHHRSNATTGTTHPGWSVVRRYVIGSLSFFVS